MGDLATWFAANHDGLLIGISVAAGLVAAMLILRELGRRAVRNDPEGWGWRSVIGRVLAKTTLAFMILAAADVVATYAELPHKIARLLDIAFVIAFALQGAVWGRELILGLIGRKVAEEQGSGTLGNAMAIEKGGRIRQSLVKFQVPLGGLAVLTSVLYTVFHFI